MVELRRVSESVMTVIVVFWKVCAEVYLCLCLARWKMFGRKHTFYDELKYAEVSSVEKTSVDKFEEIS